MTKKVRATQNFIKEIITGRVDLLRCKKNQSNGKTFKVKYLRHLIINHPNYFNDICNIYKFCKKLILIQPPGEPREQHLIEVREKRRN